MNLHVFCPRKYKANASRQLSHAHRRKSASLAVTEGDKGTLHIPLPLYTTINLRIRAQIRGWLPQSHKWATRTLRRSPSPSSCISPSCPVTPMFSSVTNCIDVDSVGVSATICALWTNGLPENGVAGVHISFRLRSSDNGCGRPNISRSLVTHSFRTEASNTTPHWQNQLQ